VLIFENWGLNLKHDTKYRPSTNFTAHFDAPTMLSHDVLRDPQAKTRSFLSSRKERIKDARQIVRSDTHSGVGKLNHNRRLQCLFVTRSRNHNLAVTFNRLLRIDDQ